MNDYYPFINTPLPYAYDALEPYIDQKTMYLHHDRHLQTYIDNLNAILKEHPDLQAWSLREFLYRWPELPPSLQVPIRNQAGGVFNHRFFFEEMAPPEESYIDLDIVKEIEKSFTDFNDFLDQLRQAALSVFGSGYAWVVVEQGKLKITTTANQNTPIDENMTPILNLDVWEHAYYLKHYNLRSPYFDDWLHVIRWDILKQRFHEAVSSKKERSFK